MYCKHCGKEIDNNSKYCQYCGNKIIDEIKSEQTLSSEIKINNNSSNTTKSIQKDNYFIRICVTIVTIIMLITLFIGLVYCSSASNKFSSINYREAKTSDITISVDNSLALSYNIIVIPKYNIKDLQLTVKFYDANKTLLSTKTKTLGNVTKNSRYTVSFSISEFSFSSLLTINNCACAVTGGTIT